MFHEDLYPNLRFCETLRQIDAHNPDLLMEVPEYVDVAEKIQTKLGKLEQPGSPVEALYLFK
jgi:hypothetical protein